jgi:hypothetical protein
MMQEANKETMTMTTTATRTRADITESLAETGSDSPSSEQSSPATKRLKSTHTTACDSVTFCNNYDDVTVGNGTGNQAVRPTSNTEDFPITDDLLLQNILSFVGEYHYRFVGSVNRHFQQLYTSLYPEKTTKFNASTMELAKLCREDIDADKMNIYGHIRLLWYSAVQHGKIDVVKYLLQSFGERYSNYKYELCSVAAKYGQIELLQWAIDSKTFIDRDERV